MLFECGEGSTVKIEKIRTVDAEFKNFLFTLGCYEGELVTVISKKKHGMVIAVKDGRYNIDKDIANLIEVA